ncbi:HNH endonuclease family protein [Paenibacillus tarimensis]|uniref:HNH endonuclease family protein n=1 Tax=Paenibacillus tarimensis TaxID=416012 RepID=UPI001F206042|nr:HNH endonuclease family protein [Paenibacillus tarimensis]MCF2942828.1 HNH endonuclease family protein [Paenibacillus tarimensis]
MLGRKGKTTVVSLLLVAALLVSTIAVLPQTASALPSGTPSKSTAQSQLNALTVKAEGSMTGYSRDKFPHWSSQGGGCDTRQVVLKRDADYYSGDCPVTSGKWYSYFDGVTVYSPSEIDVDHIVPLAEAWRSGASSWTTEQRQKFANDLNGPQLIAVTASVNRSKGDQDPSTWQPPRAGARCAYAKWWINTKYRWGLHLQSSEKSALQSMLNACSY